MSKILRLPRVIERTGLSRSTIYLEMSKGTFPHRISLGANSIGWLEKEIDEWIFNRVLQGRLRYGSSKAMPVETLPLFTPINENAQKN